MFYYILLITSLFYLPQGQSDQRTTTRRYKPVIQVTEEIDINDITFTTSSPDYERSPSHKSVNYYNGIKPEGVSKGNPYNRSPESSPSSIPLYKDSYGTIVPVEKIYAPIHPKPLSNIKYKPYKIYKIPDGKDGYRPIPHKSSGSEKSKIVIFEPPTTFSAIPPPELPRQYSTKVIPYTTSQYSSSKGPIRPTNYQNQDHSNFIPSPTFSPTVLAKLNTENQNKFAEIPDFAPEKKASDWQKPTKKPYYIKKSKNVPENHSPYSEGLTEEFPVTSKRLEENPTALYSESPRQSESYLSEVSTAHKGGSGDNNLDAVADSLDLKTGERVEFQMYGMDGPQSYKFGFDTGKGHNRHFRFEERDNTGKVKGHYGYLDEDGKMRIMKYEADPLTGFHAGPVEISPDDN